MFHSSQSAQVNVNNVSSANPGQKNVTIQLDHAERTTIVSTCTAAIFSEAELTTDTSREVTSPTFKRLNQTTAAVRKLVAEKRELSDSHERAGRPAGQNNCVVQTAVQNIRT